MKNIFRLSIIILTILVVALPVLAGSVEVEGKESSGGGIVLFIQLLTLVVVGGIIYSLFVSVGGFGGLIGKALKLIGSGILVLSVSTIDEVIEGLTDVGSETIFGEGVAHDIFHDGLTLLGFLLLAFGVSTLTKFVKSVK